MIKKFILSSISAVFIFVLASAGFVTTANAACGDLNTRGLCGAAGGCSNATDVCTWEWMGGGWDCRDGSTAGSGRCENIDQATRNVSCGVTLRSNNWCGATGGCAAGYICDSSTYTCKKDIACDNIQAGYQVQCYRSSGTLNQCGSAGKCQEGYRCSPTNASATGYACLPDPHPTFGYCPGAPGQPELPKELLCGEITTAPEGVCNCPGTSPDAKVDKMLTLGYCCGIAAGDSCYESQEARDAAIPPSPPVVIQPPTPTPTPIVIPEDGGSTGGTGGGGLNIFEGPTSEDFAELNPLEKFGDSAINSQYFTSPAGIISRVLLFAFPIAGLILFLMLVWAGFQILSGAFNGGSKSIDAGKQRATTALVGFILLFVAYWVMQIIEVIFGITIL